MTQIVNALNSENVVKVIAALVIGTLVVSLVVGLINDPSIADNLN